MSNSPDGTGGAGTVALSRRELTAAEREQRALARVTHGLYVRSPAGLKVRHYRVGRLLKRLVALHPWWHEVYVSVARAWCEYEVLAHDAFTEYQRNPSPRLLDSWRAIRRDQLPYSNALGLTPLAKTEMARDLAGVQREDAARKAQQELQRRYGRMS